MPLTDPKLWDKIRGHRYMVDDRTLNQSLCRTHDIRQVTATAAMREYRRFLYLTAVAGRRTVPSRAVDAVWHEHMEEGASDYALLLERLGRTLTHTPGTPQGHAEDYQRTRALYRREFDEEPPASHWPETGRGLALLLVGAAPLVAAGLTLLTHGFNPAVLLFGGVGLGFLGLWLFRQIKARGPVRLRDPVTGGRKRRKNDGGAACGGWDGGADCGGGGCGGD